MSTTAAKFSVRIGKNRNRVYVRTSAGNVLVYQRAFVHWDGAKAMAAKVRKHLRAGGRLDRNHWLVLGKKA